MTHCQGHGHLIDLVCEGRRTKHNTETYLGETCTEKQPKLEEKRGSDDTRAVKQRKRTIDGRFCLLPCRIRRCLDLEKGLWASRGISVVTKAACGGYVRLVVVARDRHQGIVHTCAGSAAGGRLAR
jgi:hypothetical protein